MITLSKHEGSRERAYIWGKSISGTGNNKYMVLGFEHAEIVLGTATKPIRLE